MVGVMTNLHLSAWPCTDQAGAVPAPDRVVMPSDIGVVLGVWAHPDDEVYLSAGLMAAVRRAGQRVVVASATNGELGTDDPDTLRRNGSHSSAHGKRRRPWPSSASTSTAGWGTATAPLPIRALADPGSRRPHRDVRPDTVVTFGPEGMAGHADHAQYQSE